VPNEISLDIAASAIVTVTSAGLFVGSTKIVDYSTLDIFGAQISGTSVVSSGGVAATSGNIVASTGLIDAGGGFFATNATGSSFTTLGGSAIDYQGNMFPANLGSGLGMSVGDIVNTAPFPGRTPGTLSNVITCTSVTGGVPTGCTQNSLTYVVSIP